MGVAQRIKELDPAIESYKQAIKIKPDYLDSYLNMGVSQQNKGELGAAMKAIIKPLKSSPTAEAFNSMGNVQQNKGN